MDNIYEKIGQVVKELKKKHPTLQIKNFDISSTLEEKITDEKFDSLTVYLNSLKEVKCAYVAFSGGGSGIYEDKNPTIAVIYN